MNPGVPHPGAFPAVISLNALSPTLYIKGLRNPRGGLPEVIRASFSRATSPANVGADADVPPMSVGCPFQKIRKWSACAETSGIAYGNGKPCERGCVRQRLYNNKSLRHSAERDEMLAYASVRIEEPRVGTFGERSEKLLHGGVLIRRARELRFFPSALLIYSSEQAERYSRRC